MMPLFLLLLAAQSEVVVVGGLSIIMSSSSSSIKSFSNKIPDPYGAATINYSAANEYLDEQYNQRIPNPYFPQSIVNDVPVWNGREGVYDDSTHRLVQPSLETTGFELTRKISASPIMDWNDQQNLRDHYLPELRRYFEQVYGQENIQHLLFYNPMLRGEEYQPQRSQHETPTSPTQLMAHIDNDWNASDLDRVVGLVEKQSLDYLDSDKARAKFPRDQLEQAIEDGHRFVIVNCWRNICDTPIQSHPLGVYATRYLAQNQVFPMAQPDWQNSRWYVFPHMTPEECLLFKQFDRDQRYVSDIWHTAMPSLVAIENDGKKPPPQQSTLPPRKSFDVRAFLVLNDKVSHDNDRYGNNRLEPNYKTAAEHQAATS